MTIERMTRRAMVATVALSLFISGCGSRTRTTQTESTEGRGSDARATNDEAQTGSSPERKTGGGRDGGTRAPGKNNKDRSPAPDGTGSPEATFTAELDKKCVRKGVVSELQGLTVKTTSGDTVLYSTLYSDQSTAFTHGYKTGDGHGGAQGGTFRATWAVPSNAPAGDAIVHVAVFDSEGHSRGTEKLPFTIVETTGSCP